MLIDLTIVGIFGLCIFGCWQKGLIRSIFGLVSLIAALILTNMCYPMVSSILMNTPLYSTIHDNIARAIDLEKYTEPVTQQLFDLMNNNTIITENVKNVEEHIVEYLAGLAINAIAVLVLFVAISAILKLIALSLDLIAKLPVINFMNKTGGIVVGFFMAMIIVMILNSVVTYLALLPSFENLNNQIQTSILLKLVTKQTLVHIMQQENVEMFSI